MLRKKWLLFVLILVGMVAGVDANAATSDPIQFQTDNRAAYYYVGQALSNLAAAMTNKNVATNNLTLESQLAIIVPGMATLEQTLFDDSAIIEGVALDFTLPSSVTCHGVAHNTSTDPIGAVVCDLSNNLGQFATAISALQAVPTTADPAFNAQISTAITDMQSGQTKYQDAQGDAGDLVAPLTYPAYAVENVTFYLHHAQYYLGNSGTGSLPTALVNDVTSGASPSLATDADAFTHLAVLYDQTNLAQAYNLGLAQDGTFVPVTGTPLQQGLDNLVQSYNTDRSESHRDAYHFHTLMEDLYNLGFSRGTLDDAELNTERAWFNTDQAAYFVPGKPYQGM
jgi:hypothetical protein